jgi:hypothetical protein
MTDQSVQQNPKPATPRRNIRSQRTRRVAPRFTERDGAINQELFDLLMTPADEPLPDRTGGVVVATEAPAAPAVESQSEATEHIRTEIEDVPDGGVAIRIFFRYRGRDCIAHVYHSGCRGNEGSDSTGDPG